MIGSWLFCKNERCLQHVKCNKNVYFHPLIHANDLLCRNSQISSERPWHSRPSDPIITLYSGWEGSNTFQVWWNDVPSMTDSCWCSVLKEFQDRRLFVQLHWQTVRSNYCFVQSFRNINSIMSATELSTFITVLQMLFFTRIPGDSSHCIKDHWILLLFCSQVQRHLQDHDKQDKIMSVD